MKKSAFSGLLDRLISERLTAELLGLSPDTLRRLSQRGVGPQRRKVSPRRVGYKLSDVEAYRDGKLPVVGPMQDARYCVSCLIAPAMT
jgi:predicted DNA-binding transcriptional regulator AlpA